MSKLKVNIEDSTPIVCEKCGGDVFIEGVMLRKISKFLIGQEEDGMIPIPVYTCAVCGHVNEVFRPKIDK